jgi:hypothetical protein
LTFRREFRFSLLLSQPPSGAVFHWRKYETYGARTEIKPSNFALPGGRYPIEDKNHAEAALSDVSRVGTPQQKEEVRSKVASKYSGLFGKSSK